MALARVQRTIVNKLLEMGRLTEDQAQAIVASPEEMSGDAVEKLLMADYGSRTSRSSWPRAGPST
jgi:hypothetical protein